MFGVTTRNADEVVREEFDTHFYEVRGVSGRTAEPVPDAVSTVSCFADDGTDDRDDLVPVDDAGNRATRDSRYFDWTHVCPTNDEYREGLLEGIEDAAAVSDDVRLDDVGFPRAEYCRCERCDRLFEESGFSERAEWRNSIITRFVATARTRVPGTLYVTLYPDPYPGHLSERSGIDLESVSPHVDEFVVPLYDVGYTTTYWIESLAKGFQSLLEDPFHVELYAVDVDVENLRRATEVAAEYGNAVIFAYDADNACDAIDRLPDEW